MEKDNNKYNNLKNNNEILKNKNTNVHKNTNKNNGIKNLSSLQKKDILIYGSIFIVSLVIFVLIIIYIVSSIFKLGQKAKDSNNINTEDIKTQIRKKEEAEKKIEHKIEAASPVLTEQDMQKIDFMDLAFKQMEKPKIGQPVLNIKFKGIDEILKIKLYPEYAQQHYLDLEKAVNNRYYIGKELFTFKDSKTVGLALGTKGNSGNIWKVKQKIGSHYHIAPYYGALCVKTRPDKQVGPFGDNLELINMKYNNVEEQQLLRAKFPDSMIMAYNKFGGKILNGIYEQAVLGQTYEGINVIETISKNTTKKYYVEEMKITINDK